jgi:adenylyltransferase/sulfurtransferase
MTDREDLDPKELQRYARHLTLPEVGYQGQLRLKQSSALIIGAGGLGSPVGLYLAAAGVGRIGLVDFDRVDASNLQRQVLYTDSDIGRSKVEVATARLKALNPQIEIEPWNERLDADNVAGRIASYDVVLDGTDNFETRYLINDACVLGGVPNVYGSIFRFEGQVSRFAEPDGPCYRCLYPAPPPAGEIPNCAEGGVLGILPGLIGTMQATEAIKGLLGIGRSLKGRLLLIDTLEMRIRELSVPRDPDCPVCGERPTILRPETVAASCSTPLTERSEGDGDWSVEQLSERLQDGSSLYLLDIRKEFERRICRLQDHAHIPMDTLSARLSELPNDTTLVVYCRSGARSAQVVRWLHGQGYPKARNLSGGILAWGKRIDPKFPRY